MFEHFTDRARRVMVLAQEEARLLSHNFIGTEHLLLGLIREDEGAAGKALASLGVGLGAVRQKVEERSGATPPPRRPLRGAPPFTPRSRQVLEQSLREAHELGEEAVGTQHILLALVRQGDGVAVDVLVELGVDSARVRAAVLEQLASHPDREDGPHPGARPDEAPPEAGPVAPKAEPVGLQAETPGPRCGRCGASLVEHARYRLLDIGPADDVRHEHPSLSVPVVFCAQCGAVVGSLPAGSGPAVAEARPGNDARAQLRSPAGHGSVQPRTVVELENDAGGVPPVAVGRHVPERPRQTPDDMAEPVHLGDVAPSARVELAYRNRSLVGTVGGSEVRLQLDMPSHRGTARGAFLATELAATWHVDDNSSMSDSGARLAGRLAGASSAISGRFHLGPGLFLDRAEIEGDLGGEAFQALVVAAGGGLGSTSTVAVDGSIGPASFELFGAVAPDLSRSAVRGTLDGRPVRLDASRDRTTAAVRVLGAYEGPPALLALIVGALLYFP